MKWISIDLDETIAQGIWSPENPTREIGPPIEHNIKKMKAVAEAGWKIAIYTARSWNDYETIEWWLDFHQLPYDRIVCGKLLVAWAVDDKAIHESEEDWTGGRSLA